MDGHQPNITYNIHGCPIEYKPEDPTRLFSSKGITLDIPRIGWIISGCFTLMSIVTSFILIYRHCQYYTNPNQQRHIVRILLMVPIYATTSWFSYVYVRESVYYESIRTLYEAFVVSSFFILMLQYLGSTLADQKRILKTHKKTERWLFPLCCMKYNPSRLHFLQFMKWGILQYVPLKVFTTFLAIVLESQGTYCEESWNPKFGHVWVLIIDFTAVSISTYFLIMFYVTIHKDLKKYQPLLKFLAIKLVIFFSFWQMIAIEGLVFFNVIKETQYWTTGNIATGLNAFIIDIEMFAFALLHLKAFSYKPYVPRKPVPPKDKSPLGDREPSLSRLGSTDNIDLEKNDPQSGGGGTRRGSGQERRRHHAEPQSLRQKYPDLSSPKAAIVASSVEGGIGRNKPKSAKGGASSNSGSKGKKNSKDGKDRDLKKSKAPERLPSKAEREALMDYEKTTSVWRGLIDAFNPLDTVREVWFGIRYLYRWSRGLPVDRDHQRLMDLETAFGRVRPEPGLGKKDKEKDEKDKDKNKKKKKKKNGSEEDEEDGDEKKKKKDEDHTDEDSNDGEKKKKARNKGGIKKGKDDDDDDDSDDDDSETKSIDVEDAYTIDDGDSSDGSCNADGAGSDESDPDNIRGNPNIPGYHNSSKNDKRWRPQPDVVNESLSRGRGIGSGGMTNKERMEEKAKLVVVTKKGVEYLPKEAASRTELAHIPSIKLKPVRKKELLSGLYAAHPHLKTSSSFSDTDQWDPVIRHNAGGNGGGSSSSWTRTPDIMLPHPPREPLPRSLGVDRGAVEATRRGGGRLDVYSAHDTPPPFLDRSSGQPFAVAAVTVDVPSDQDLDGDNANNSDNESSSMFYHSREGSHSDPELHLSSANRSHDQYLEQLERLEKERQLYHFHHQQELWRQHLEQLEQEQREEQEAAEATAAAQQRAAGSVLSTTEHELSANRPGDHHTPDPGMTMPTEPVSPQSPSSISPMSDHPLPLPEKEASENHSNSNSNDNANNHHVNFASNKNNLPIKREVARRYSMDSLDSTGSLRRRDRRPDPRLYQHQGDPASFTARRRFYQQLAHQHQDQIYARNREYSQSPPTASVGYDQPIYRSQWHGGGPPPSRMPHLPAPAALPHPYGMQPRDDYYEASGGEYEPRSSHLADHHLYRYGSSPPPLPTSMPIPYGGSRHPSMPRDPPREARYARPSSPETLFPVSRYAPPHLREYEYQQWLQQQDRGSYRGANGPLHSPARTRGRSNGDGQGPYAPDPDDFPYDTRYYSQPQQQHHFPDHREYLPLSSARERGGSDNYNNNERGKEEKEVLARQHHLHEHERSHKFY